MKKVIKLILIILPVILILNIKINAEIGRAGVTLPILNYVAGTRALGVGTAYTAMADDITSLFWNPAGLGRLTRQQVYGLFEPLYEGCTYFSAGYALPFYGIGVFGIGLVGLTSGDLEGTDENGSFTENFSANQTMLIISYGTPLDNLKKLTSKHFRFLDVGASIKLIRHSIHDYSSIAFGMDIGIKYIPLKTTPVLRNFIFGITAQNIIPPTMKMESEREWYPFKIKFGTAYRAFYDTLIIALEIDKIANREQPAEIAVGLEYWTFKLFRLRMGYKDGLGAGGFSCGAGIEVNDFTFDYALNYNNNWGLVHQFAASLRFGEFNYK